MSKHTPGPWWVTRGREVRAHKPAGSPVVLDTVGICEVYSGGAGIDGADANARLIAAAPDMLEALVDLCFHIGGEDQVWDNALKAIAKAKGEA